MEKQWEIEHNDITTVQKIEHRKDQHAIVRKSPSTLGQIIDQYKLSTDNVFSPLEQQQSKNHYSSDGTVNQV